MAQQHDFRVRQRQHDPQPRLDEPGLTAPAELRNRTDHEPARTRREHLAQLVQNLRRRCDRIYGEQKLPDDSVLEPVAQRSTVQRPFDRQNPAKTLQGKAKPQFDLWLETHTDDDEKVERFNAQKADRCDTDLGEFQLEDATILFFDLVIPQIAAAGDNSPSSAASLRPTGSLASIPVRRHRPT